MRKINSLRYVANLRKRTYLRLALLTLLLCPISFQAKASDKLGKANAANESQTTESSFDFASPQQAISVSGIVSGGGEPLIGVSVTIKNTSTGTITNSEGKYTINVPDKNAVLVFSYLGYVRQEHTVGSRTSLDVQMVEDSKVLDEIVVVGYGVQKKVNLTGAIGQVGAKELQDRPVANITQMIQGAVPGLNVTFSGGRPGQGGSLNVRGTTSLNGGAPLVLVDGIPSDINRINPGDVESISVLKDAAASAIYGARGAFGVILVTTKEAKKGKTSISYSNNFGWSSPTVSTDFLTTGYDHVMLNDEAFKRSTGNTYTRYSDEDYAELLARRNDKVEDPSRPWVVVKPFNGKDIYNYYGNYDWWHTIFQDVQPSQQHNASVQGSNDKISYLLSASFYQKEGIMKVNTDKYQSITFRSKINAKLTDWLNISNNTSFFDSKYRYYGEEGGGANNFIYATVHALPAYAPINPDGTATYNTRKNNYSIGDGRFADLLGGISGGQDAIHEFQTSTQLEAKIAKPLMLTGNFSYMATIPDNWYRFAKAYYSSEPGVILEVPNKQIDQFKKNMSYEPMFVSNLFMTYDDQYGKHHLGGVIGMNYENKQSYRVEGRRKDLLSRELNDLNLGTGEMEAYGGSYEYTLFGLFGRLNYDYNGKYLLEFNGRYDGTSRFGEGHRYGFFPSFSGGWRISEEAFFEPAKKSISNLKLRASYGTLGNQLPASTSTANIYPYLSLMSSAQSNWLTNGVKTNYVTMPAPVRTDLTWEKTETVNLGLDLGFFNNRLNATADVYERKTIGMLTAGAALPGVFGASPPRQNSADLSTKGFEASLAWQDNFDVAGKPFSYKIAGSVSDYKTVIDKYKDNPNYILETRGNYMGSYMTSELFTRPYEGQDVGEIWGFTTDGYFKTDEEAQSYAVDQSYVNKVRQSSPGEWSQLKAGDLKFIDYNKNGKIDIGDGTLDNPGDLKVIGNRTPRYSYGINLDANWNGFELAVFMQGVAKRDWYPGNNTDKFWGPYSRSYFSFIPKDFADDVWTPENPNAYYPILRGYDALNSGGQLYYPVAKYLQNIGYLRLKNIVVGYNLPEKWAQKIKMQKCRIYFSGENLLTFSPLRSDYLDPEQPLGDLNARVYPLSKTLSFGIDLTF